MPYLTQEDRKALEEAEASGNFYIYLGSLELRKFAGHLNFIIFKTVRVWIYHNKVSYFSFATIVGTIVCCVLEIYRRLVAPYENSKIKQNGDVK